jgi:hypothetical protein
MQRCDKIVLFRDHIHQFIASAQKLKGISVLFLLVAVFFLFHEVEHRSCKSAKYGDKENTLNTKVSVGTIANNVENAKTAAESKPFFDCL